MIQRQVESGGEKLSATAVLDVNSMSAIKLSPSALLVLVCYPFSRSNTIAQTSVAVPPFVYEGGAAAVRSAEFSAVVEGVLEGAAAGGSRLAVHLKRSPPRQRVASSIDITIPLVAETIASQDDGYRPPSGRPQSARPISGALPPSTVRKYQPPPKHVTVLAALPLEAIPVPMMATRPPPELKPCNNPYSRPSSAKSAH